MNVFPCTLASDADQLSVCVGQDKLTLPAAARAAVAGSTELLFGVRPEDIHLAPRDGTQPVHGHVELVEPLLERWLRNGRRALDAAGIRRLDQLTRFSKDKIKQLHGIGPYALDQLRRALAAKGLSFARGK